MEQKNFNQSNTMNRDALGAFRMGYERLPPNGTWSFVGSQYEQGVRNARRDFQTNTQQQVSNYSSGYPQGMRQRETEGHSSSLKLSDRSAMGEYTGGFYPKSILEDERINYLGQMESQLRNDYRSNVDNPDSFRNYSTLRSPASSSRSDYQRNSMTSDLNPEIDYHRLSPELGSRVQFRNSRNDTSLDGNFRMDSREGLWQTSSDRYRDNIDSNSSFTNNNRLFDTNARMQLATANMGRQENYVRGNCTATSRMIDADYSAGYGSNVSSGLRQAEPRSRFLPSLGRNQARNETPRPLFPSLGRSRFGQPSASGNVSTELLSNMPGSQRRNRRRKNPFQVKNEFEKRQKFDAPQTTIQQAAEVIKVLLDMKSTEEVSGTAAITTQLSAAPSKKKRKKKSNKQNPDKKFKVPQQKFEVSEKNNKEPGNEPEVSKFTPQVQNLTDLSAIVCRNYPFQRMSVKQVTLLHDVFLQELEKISDESLRRQIQHCYRWRLCLMVICSNDGGLEWLKKAVKTLHPWDGVDFRVIRQGPLNFNWTVIVGNDFPQNDMTLEQLNTLQEALSNEMNELSDDAQPQFVECCQKRGTLMIAYSRQKDFEWLKNTVQGLEPWEGAQLRLLDIEDVPAFNKIKISVPFQFSSYEGVLARLDHENEGLNIADWHVFQRRKGGSDLLASVGDDVIEALEKIDNKPFLDGNRITVVNLGKMKTMPFSVSEYEEDLMKVRKIRKRRAYVNKIEINFPFQPNGYKRMLTKLGRENEGLNVANWLVFQRRKGGSKLLVSVGDDEIEALKKIDYKPFLNGKRITIVNLGKMKTLRAGLSEYEAHAESQAEDVDESEAEG